MTIVMITQKIEEIEEFGDRLAIIDQGKIVEIGTLTEIKNRYDCNQYILQITLPKIDDESALPKNNFLDDYGSFIQNREEISINSPLIQRMKDDLPFYKYV